MKHKIVTFGEIMMRLAPYNFERIVQAGQFQVTYGGGEANVAVSLAHLGQTVWFVSRLPENALGDAAINHLRGYGVHAGYILRGGKRIGAYFLEHGASIRPSKVIYDRSDSAISQAEKGMFDWDNIFSGKEWFHITGISPALSVKMAEVSLEAVQAAKRNKLTVSCDLNYRKKLWTKDQARELMQKLVQFVDIIVSNEEDAADVFGIEVEKANVISGKLSVDHYRSVAEQLMQLGPVKKVAITLRESKSASDNNWSALLFNGKEFLESRKYSIHLIDRVGGGDSFCAGLINGLIQSWDDQNALEFAVAASGLKQTIPGDMNLVSESEVMSILKGDISGRVQR